MNSIIRRFGVLVLFSLFNIATALAQESPVHHLVCYKVNSSSSRLYDSETARHLKDLGIVGMIAGFELVRADDGVSWELSAIENDTPLRDPSFFEPRQITNLDGDIYTELMPIALTSIYAKGVPFRRVVANNLQCSVQDLLVNCHDRTISSAASGWPSEKGLDSPTGPSAWAYSFFTTLHDHETREIDSSRENGKILVHITRELSVGLSVVSGNNRDSRSREARSLSAIRDIRFNPDKDCVAF